MAAARRAWGGVGLWFEKKSAGWEAVCDDCGERTLCGFEDDGLELCHECGAAKGRLAGGFVVYIQPKPQVPKKLESVCGIGAV